MSVVGVMFVLFMLSFELLCLCSVGICVVFDCKCKSLKRLGENMNINKRNKET